MKNILVILFTSIFISITGIQAQDCTIENGSFSITQCDEENSNYDFAILFNHTGVSDSFDLGYLSNHIGTYSYNNLPITITNFDFHADTVELFIIDGADSFCVGNIFLPPVETCEEGDCEISNITVDRTSCTNNTFDVAIDFDVTSGSDEGFLLTFGGIFYGIFDYDELPVTLTELSGDCVIEYQALIRDAVNPQCAGDALLGVVCCEDEVCNIELDNVNTSECGANAFDLSFAVTNQMTSDSFQVSVNGNILGNYAYSDSSFTITNVSGFGLETFELQVCDLVDASCCTIATFMNPCICSFMNVTQEIINCDENSGTYDVILDFDYAASSDSFIVGGAGFLVVFAYDDLPVVAGPLELSDDDTELLLIDNDDALCFGGAYIGIVNDCDINCQLFNLNAEATACMDNSYLIDFEFSGQDLESGSFEVFVNDISFGQFEYADDDYQIGPISGNCNITPVLTIVDINNEACSDFFAFPEPICCDVACDFELFTAEVECLDTETLLTIAYSNPGALATDQFSIAVNDSVFGPFSYSNNDIDLSLSIIDFPNGTYSVDIFDNNDENCSAQTSIDITCGSPCTLAIDSVIVLPCDDGFFDAVLFTDLQNTNGENIIFSVNGLVLSDVIIENDTVLITELPGDCITQYTFLIEDESNTPCSADYTLEEPVCCNSSCIDSLIILDYECINDSLHSLVFDLEYSSPSDSFFIPFSDFIITFAYADLPVTIPFVLIQPIQLTFVDQDIPECGLVEFIDLPCEDPCTINDITYHVVECDENAYEIILDFTHDGISDSFYLIQNGDTLRTYNYDEMVINIDMLELDINYTFELVDVNEADCSASINVFENLCESSNTEILLSGISINTLGTDIYLENSDNEPLSISIYNTQGSLIRSLKASDQMINLTESIAAHGLLIVQVTNMEGESKSFKAYRNR